MRSAKSSGPLRRPKLLIIRRVNGGSMLPGLKPGQLVLASSLVNPKIGCLIILKHDGLEKIKRLVKVSDHKIYVEGDNSLSSTDSRQFGWINKSTILASVIWPR